MPASHPNAGTIYADVIVPLAIQQALTYRVPEELVADVRVGLRVEVQVGPSKHHSGIVSRVHGQAPPHSTKPILSLIDLEPVATERLLDLWRWLADYYACTLGEVMIAGLPGHLKLSSETMITLGPLYHDNETEYTDQEYLIVEALSIQEQLSISDIRDILGKKTITPVIRQLLDRRIIFRQSELTDRYKPLMIRCVRFTSAFGSAEERMGAFDLVQRAERQAEVLLEMLNVAGKQSYVRTTDLLKRTGATSSVLNALVKKGIFEIYEREISRLATDVVTTGDLGPLSEQQIRARTQGQGFFEAGKPVLLHGVTGSGKTRVYLEWMRQAIERGEQVLYLLPEIALTGQIIKRLQQVLGDKIMVYHSQLNDMERVEIWHAVMAGTASVVGPRSGIFLPFRQLGLIVVDEEHDPSYKQQEPAPRYNGRDVAVYLAYQHGARIVLGTATPSLESWTNAQSGKYGLVSMPERFGGLELPTVEIANLRESDEHGNVHPFLTPTLLTAMRQTLARREQVILFQNRRGFAPLFVCETCLQAVECINCDVSLTYHKYQDRLRCHCCGYATPPPEVCTSCGNASLKLRGAGTEKIEDELKIFLPGARVARLDYETTRGKNKLSELITRFELGDLDVLVGTQMVTKGLDFDKVGLVGIINADQLLRFPDFRADERAFQLMLQVAGRAGRKHRRGRVIIQAFNQVHPVLADVIANDYDRFVEREARNRAAHRFPPFQRMIRLQFRHPRRVTVEDAARLAGNWLHTAFGEALEGPFEPSVARLRTYYLQDMVLRLPNTGARRVAKAKTTIGRAVEKLNNTKGFSGVRVVVDVDPY